VDEVEWGMLDRIWTRLRGLDAFFLHLAEGVDDRSRAEFTTLREKGLLIEPLVIIHGTALERGDFEAMAEAGAKLVWSPLSNLLLYGATADVRAAVDAGVLVSLGSDWSRTGSKNLLGELAVADRWNHRALSPPLTDWELARMVTANPARAVGWDDRLGTLRPGLLADLLVIRDPGGSPYRALIEAREEDVLLVTVGGDPRYGLPEWMERLKPRDWEAVACGEVERGLDITQGGVDWEGRSFADIEGTLEEAMRFERWIGTEEFEGLEPVGLTPLMAGCDEEYRGVVRRLFGP
jgi:hypothetical protein